MNLSTVLEKSVAGICGMTIALIGFYQVFNNEGENGLKREQKVEVYDIVADGSDSHIMKSSEERYKEYFDGN